MTPMTSHMEELDRGWSWVVLAASFGYFMIFGMFLYGIGMVHEVLLLEYGGKSSSTAWVGSLFASLVSLGGPVSSVIIDKWSCRTAMFIDGIMTAVGCLATAFSPNLILCIFTYGIMAGFGSGLGYTATMVVVGFNFRRWRSTALCIALSGVGVGTCIFTPIMELIRDFYGTSGYFIILSGIACHKCLFAVLCRPSKLETVRQQSLLNNENENQLTRKQILKIYAKVYGNKLILCFSLSLLLFSLGTYMIFLHIPSYSIWRGSSRIAATILISVSGLATIVARMLTTFVTDKKNYDEIVLYCASFGVLALGTFLFPVYSRSYVGLVIYSFLLGAYFGGCYAIMNNINVKLVGIKYLSIATGMELLFSAIGTAIGPVVTGMILDEGGTFEHAFMVAAFAILVGSGLGMATVVFQPDEDKLDASDVDLVMHNNGDIFNETASTMITSSMMASSLTQGKRNSKEAHEKHDTECQEFTADQKATCLGGACPSSSKRVQCHQPQKSPSFQNNAHSSADNKIVRDKNIYDLANGTEPLNFTEEIQKLLKGEELKYADDTDSIADF